MQLRLVKLRSYAIVLGLLASVLLVSWLAKASVTSCPSSASDCACDHLIFCSSTAPTVFSLVQLSAMDHAGMILDTAEENINSADELIGISPDVDSANLPLQPPAPVAGPGGALSLPEEDVTVDFDPVSSGQ